jgi:prevent-host-death family protein
MKSVGIFEAKTHLSALLDEVEKGGEVTITRHGKPAAKLVQATVEFSPVAVSRLLNEGPTPRLDSILAAHDIIVPSHWIVEVGHGILKALQRKTISQEHLSETPHSRVRQMTVRPGPTNYLSSEPKPSGTDSAR